MRKLDIVNAIAQGRIRLESNSNLNKPSHHVGMSVQKYIEQTVLGQSFEFVISSLNQFRVYSKRPYLLNPDFVTDDLSLENVVHKYNLRSENILFCDDPNYDHLMADNWPISATQIYSLQQHTYSMPNLWDAAYSANIGVPLLVVQTLKFSMHARCVLNQMHDRSKSNYAIFMSNVGILFVPSTNFRVSKINTPLLRDDTVCQSVILDAPSSIFAISLSYPDIDICATVRNFWPVAALNLLPQIERLVCAAPRFCLKFLPGQISPCILSSSFSDFKDNFTYFSHLLGHTFLDALIRFTRVPGSPRPFHTPSYGLNFYHFKTKFLTDIGVKNVSSV